jgi:peptidoglycan LD-endopeptidase CwlK
MQLVPGLWAVIGALVGPMANLTCAGPLGDLPHVSAEPQGTPADPIVDSAMTEKEAFDGLPPGCPAEIRRRQRLLDVTYYSFDGKVHRGQLVVDQDLAADVQHVFEVARKTRFPIGQAVPVSHPRFRRNGVWDDHLSMAANNTSGFNYRAKEGAAQWSCHASGRAIDVNPRQNPYIKGKTVLPPGAKLDPQAAGTLTENHPIVRAFLERGWQWGGHWKTLKDYQHFEKPLPDKK